MASERIIWQRRSARTSHDIEVAVEVAFAPRESHAEGAYIYAYRIRITNHSAHTVRLISRHWLITDAHGNVEEVIGPGVVGETPRLQPETSFQYTSFCPLETPHGEMRGWYQMVTEHGQALLVEIPPFLLARPHAVN